MSWGDWLAKAVRAHGRRTAVVDTATGTRYSYAEMDARAVRTARLLAGRFGVRQGDRVAVLAKNRIEQIDLYFACQKIGAILVPLNWRLAPAELEKVAVDCAPRVLLAEPALDAGARAMAAAVASMAQVSFDAGDHGLPVWSALVSDPSSVVLDPVRPRDEDPLMLLYTSGTTGLPKGVMITHRQIVANSLNTGLACDLVSTDVTVLYTPLFHTGAWHVLATPLWHRGGTVVLMPGFDAAQLLNVVATEKVTCLFGVPTTFQMLAEHADFAKRDLSSVRFCLCGGAPCPVSLIEQYAQRGLMFRQGFGMTEVGPNCFSLPPEDAVRKAGTVGFPIFHCEARVMRDDGKEAAVGEVGELWLAGPHVSGGYWNRPDATADVRHGEWFRTGDLASKDDEGYFKIAGRKKDMFISGGENVYPAEVENALAAHPAVLEATVIGVADTRWGEVGRGVVVLRPGHAATADELLAHCAGRLAKYKVPKSIVFAADLPHNASGKVVKADVVAKFGA
jgi:fatty-acyl-CoA synthase